MIHSNLALCIVAVLIVLVSKNNEPQHQLANTI